MTSPSRSRMKLVATNGGMNPTTSHTWKTSLLRASLRVHVCMCACVYVCAHGDVNVCARAPHACSANANTAKRESDMAARVGESDKWTEKARLQGKAQRDAIAAKLAQHRAEADLMLNLR